MGTVVKQAACPSCPSSDGFTIYEDDNGKFNGTCFVCNFYAPKVDPETLEVTDKKNSPNDYKVSIAEIAEYDTRGVSERKLKRSSCEFYGMKAGYAEDGDSIGYHYYPFHKDGKLVGYQERDVAKKNFKSIGYGKADIEFQGQNCFPKNSTRSVVITEGFLDAVAFHQVLATKYGETKAANMPVISLPNGVGSVLKIAEANYEYLVKFDKVVLAFDQDKPGREAAEKLAKLLPARKTFIMSFSEKDACDMLIKGKSHELVDSFFQAEDYTPVGIVTSANTYDLVKNKENKESIPYPDCMQEVNTKTYGHRQGEIVLFTAGTGSGKTQFMREDIFHLLNTTSSKIGICSLEEGIEDTALGIMSVAANKRLHLPDVEYTDEEYDAAWDATMKEDRIMFLDHQGSVSDDSLMSKIEYMAATGHKYIFLDHITIAVSDSGNGVNAAIDAAMSDLLKIVKRHNVWLGVVSHLRKVKQDAKSFEEGAVPTEDDLKGSGSLKQVPFDTIAFSRNKYAKSERVRNTVEIHVLKCRYTGRTGFAGKALFTEETGRLTHIDPKTEELEAEDAEDFII